MWGTPKFWRYLNRNFGGVSTNFGGVETNFGDVSTKSWRYFNDFLEMFKQRGTSNIWGRRTSLPPPGCLIMRGTEKFWRPYTWYAPVLSVYYHTPLIKNEFCISDIPTCGGPRTSGDDESSLPPFDGSSYRGTSSIRKRPPP